MPLALIMSSHVAGSRVGGSAQALALAQFKIDPVVVPTVLYGRHPGWGAPGGAQAPLEVFEGMLDGIEANGLFGMADVVITGYFASAAQVRAAARAVDAVRGAPRPEDAKRPIIIVDPTLGDSGKGLYVPQEVAQAVVQELLPRADIIAPNAWELERLTGAETRNPIDAMKAGRLLGKPVLVSSVVRGQEIGVVYTDKTQGWLAAHARAATAPRGSGDLLTALFAAALIEGQPVNYALARAASGVAETIAAAQIWQAPELPLVAMGSRLKAASPGVRIERLA